MCPQLVEFCSSTSGSKGDLQGEIEEVESLSRILEERKEMDAESRRNRVMWRQERVLVNGTLNATRIFARRVCEALQREGLVRCE